VKQKHVPLPDSFCLPWMLLGLRLSTSGVRQWALGQAR